jgi:hypothetical protein
VNVVGPRSGNVVEREIEGCFALLQPETAEVLVLNESASDVWRLASEGELTLDAIVVLLAKAYGAEPEAIRDDVEQTVAFLTDRGFITPSAGL